ncbi:MAG: hypothetical protein DHS20C18_12940 [Saprospiraceae bacterium]|nr:MAG: hypothetical protein DHS20C18_12940 [Saprospiraceae bacterium]
MKSKASNPTVKQVVAESSFTLNGPSIELFYDQDPKSATLAIPPTTPIVVSLWPQEEKQAQVFVQQGGSQVPIPQAPNGILSGSSSIPFPFEHNFNGNRLTVINSSSQQPKAKIEAGVFGIVGDPTYSINYTGNVASLKQGQSLRIKVDGTLKNLSFRANGTIPQIYALWDGDELKEYIGLNIPMNGSTPNLPPAWLALYDHGNGLLKVASGTYSKHDNYFSNLFIVNIGAANQGSASIDFQ